MEDIAVAAGLAKPSLYHYFATRDEILSVINEQAFNFLFDKSAQRAAQTDDPVRLLRGVFEDTFDMHHSLPGYSRVIAEQLRHLAPEYRSEIFAKRRRWQIYVEGLVQSGLDSGQLSGPDAHHATLALFGMINWSHQWYSPTGPTSYSELAGIFFEIFMRGIASPDGGTSRGPVTSQSR